VPPSAVYAAEEQWSAVLDRGGTIDFFGSRLDVPLQRRFADVGSVQAYVDVLLAAASVREAYPQAGAVTVRERTGQGRAHYQPADAVIALPLRTLWAGREAVVLHELAHHLACGAGAEADPAGVRWHGPQFRAAMDVLVTEALGEAAALLLRAGYDAAGVRS
jgi:putative metallohydrolase (TIGR04338 family)